ncbi:MAG: toll/interleukin-1 receptor domain-containing protein [Candidatus Magnetomorum sp.]|nr:toll/interleukin-1 receptor domain-containing protein [Candidatus Magnetomorum sp.]
MKTFQQPVKFFEEQGFVSPSESYFVPFDNVVNTKKQNMETMVNLGRYFTIFAPRQSGKTTFFYDFCRSLENDPLYIIILMSFQTYHSISAERFYARVDETIKKQLINRLLSVQCSDVKAVKQYMDTNPVSDHLSFYQLFENLNNIINKKKIVIFIDEFEGMPPSEIFNFLMTLRDLYQNYKQVKDKALYSVGLVGIRNMSQLVVDGISPFNIADQVTLPPFNLNNIHDLYAQFTQETNQPFKEDAIQKIHEQTQGQPWLVNRIGTILTTQIRPNTIEPISIDDVNQAVTILVDEHNDHFDNLLEKILLYKKTFLNICNNHVAYVKYDESQAWLMRHGIIKRMNNKVIVSNPIYKTVFSSLTSDQKAMEMIPKKIFICYSHEDKHWIEKLAFYLKQLQHQGISFWYDERIRAGDIWPLEIQTAIETSHLIICLISDSFLASDFIRTKEIPAIQQRQKEGITVFPILLEDCMWQVINWLQDIQIFSHMMPLDSLNEKDLKKQFMGLNKDIMDCFENKRKDQITIHRGKRT